MLSSSLLLSVGVLSALSPAVFATKYSQFEIFTAANWLDAFKFETVDYNNGFVNYVNEATAKNTGLYGVDADGDIKFGVDATEKLNANTDKGRKSVRLEGKKNYNKGLFVLDVKQMPGVCGMWPSFWSLGQEPWPVKGEIDIIEGVNNMNVNKYVLHTDTMCKVDGRGMTANPASLDCALDGANGSAGCDVNENRPGSFGSSFRGGSYVMEWDSDVIQMWFFARGSVPASLNTNSPDTSQFGPPAAKFAGSGCDIEKRFKDQRFIFTNNFCGDWAGNVYSTTTCPRQFAADGRTELNSQDSCRKYVAEHPEAFTNQFWKIGSFKTYKKSTVVSSSSSSSSMSRTSSIISSSTHVSSSASSTHVSSSTTTSSRTSLHVSSTSLHVSSTSLHVSSTSSHVSSSASGVSSSSSSVVASVSSSASSSAHSSISSHVQSSSSSSHFPSSTEIHMSSTPAASVSSDFHSSSSIHVSSSTEIHMSSTPAASVASDVHSSSPIHTSSSSDVHASSTTTASVSSDVHLSSSVAHPPPSSEIHTSSAPASSMSSSSTMPYTTSYSSSASAHYYGNFSAPAYQSTPPATSTPCTTSSAKIASPTPGYPHSNSASVPSYEEHPSYPVSSPVKNDYPYLPSFTPLSPTYPAMTSQASYNDYYATPISKTTITTTYTTTYIDVCETGYTTKTTTFAVTYCPTLTPQPTPGKPSNTPTYGWDITTKVCQYGCGEGPKTVTVIVPCTKCDLSKPTPTPSMPNKPSCNGYDCQTINVTTKVYSTKIITLTKSPVPEVPRSSSKPVDASKSTPAVSSKPTPSVYGGGKNNGTVSISIGTGIKPTASKTGYSPPVFTGGASGIQVGGVLAMVGVVAALVL